MTCLSSTSNCVNGARGKTNATDHNKRNDPRDGGADDRLKDILTNNNPIFGLTIDSRIETEGAH